MCVWEVPGRGRRLGSRSGPVIGRSVRSRAGSTRVCAEPLITAGVGAFRGTQSRCRCAGPASAVVPFSAPSRPAGDRREWCRSRTRAVPAPHSLIMGWASGRIAGVGSNTGLDHGMPRLRLAVGSSLRARRISRGNRFINDSCLSPLRQAARIAAGRSSGGLCKSQLVLLASPLRQCSLSKVRHPRVAAAASAVAPRCAVVILSRWPGPISGSSVSTQFVHGQFTCNGSEMEVKFRWVAAAFVATAIVALVPGVAGAATPDPRPSAAAAESATEFCPWKTTTWAPVYAGPSLSDPVLETLPPGTIFHAAKNMPYPFRHYDGHGKVSTRDIVISGVCYH
jgi:hypothetical protein